MKKKNVIVICTLTLIFIATAIVMFKKQKDVFVSVSLNDNAISDGIVQNKDILLVAKDFGLEPSINIKGIGYITLKEVEDAGYIVVYTNNKVYVSEKAASNDQIHGDVDKAILDNNAAESDNKEPEGSNPETTKPVETTNPVETTKPVETADPVETTNPVEANNPEETTEPEETTPYPDEPIDIPENRKAGNFVSKNLITVDKSADYEYNLGKLNKMIWETYGFTYTPFLTQYGTNRMVGRLMYDSENNRYGFKYTSWRKSYDSSLPQNNALNIVLETFYFFTGDKDVAKALWSWIDDANVNDRPANTDNFGFTDVGPDGTQFVVTMNGIDIGIDESTYGEVVIWFR